MSWYTGALSAARQIVIFQDALKPVSTLINRWILRGGHILQVKAGQMKNLPKKKHLGLQILKVDFKLFTFNLINIFIGLEPIRLNRRLINCFSKFTEINKFLINLYNIGVYL